MIVFASATPAERAGALTVWRAARRTAGIPPSQARIDRVRHGAGAVRPYARHISIVFVDPERWGRGVGGRRRPRLVGMALLMPQTKNFASDPDRGIGWRTDVRSEPGWDIHRRTLGGRRGPHRRYGPLRRRGTLRCPIWIRTSDRRIRSSAGRCPAGRIWPAEANHVQGVRLSSLELGTNFGTKFLRTHAPQVASIQLRTTRCREEAGQLPNRRCH